MEAKNQAPRQVDKKVRKTKKIAYKIATYYFIFAVITILIAAPICHIVTKERYQDGVEELFHEKLDSFKENILPQLDSSTIPIFNTYNEDLQIKADEQLEKHVFKAVFFPQTSDLDKVEYCEMKVPIEIQNKPYTFYMHIRGVTTRSFVKNTAILFSSIILALILGLIIISIYISKRLGKQFEETVQIIQGFDIGKDLTQPPAFPNSDVEELAIFTKILAKRMQLNINIHNSQREFVENAAHELQTPLSILQGHINLLSQDEYMSKERLETLNSIQKNVSRMNRLNRNLLLLSKLEHDSYSHQEEININKMLHEHLNFFEEQAIQKEIKINVEYNGTLEVICNPTLMEVLLRNLFMNAIRHNIPQGSISTLLNEESLTVSNTGENKALDEQVMWNRFHKSNIADKGSGLGLSLIKKIIEINQWEIEYHFENATHSFKVNMKKK